MSDHPLLSAERGLELRAPRASRAARQRRSAQRRGSSDPSPCSAALPVRSSMLRSCCGVYRPALVAEPSPWKNAVAKWAAHRRAACASEGADVPVARCGLVEAEGSVQMAAFAPSDLPDFSSVLAHDAPPCPRCYQSRVAGQQVCSEKSVGECRGGHGRVASSAATVDGGRNAASPGWPPVESCQRFSAAARASQQADDRGSAA